MGKKSKGKSNKSSDFSKKIRKHKKVDFVTVMANRIGKAMITVMVKDSTTGKMVKTKREFNLDDFNRWFNRYFLNNPFGRRKGFHVGLLI